MNTRERKFFSYLSVLLLLAIESTRGADEPLVEISLGKIQGSILQSQRGADIYAFRGIRYAKAPLNELRFTAPVAVESWSDTYDATSDSLMCPQPGIKTLMSEDCLKLNVFSPNLSGSAPVMVYIHGGSNIRGSGHSLYEAGPQYLLDHDVVLVAINYRLGALGFLSTRTAEAPGNYGYLDQVEALKWIKSHISKFGGDPNSVTIFGLSAGAMAVTLHMASPQSKGLFHKAIAMSGSATNHYAIDNLEWTRKLAREVSCPMYNPKDVVDCLRGVSWETIIDTCVKWEPYYFINMKWNFEVDGRFLVKHPNDVFLDGDFHMVPILTGFTKNELDYSAYHQENNTGLLNDISLNFDLYAPELFLYNATDNVDESTNTKKSDKIKGFYLGANATISSDNLESFGQIFSDAIIGDGVFRLVQMARKYVNVYYYRLDYVGSRGAYLNAEGNPRGVGHGDDLQYVMPSAEFNPQLPLDHPDMFMVDRINQWWTSFARIGAPELDVTGIVQWTPNTVDEAAVMYNNKEITFGGYSYMERYDLWDDLFPPRAESKGSQTAQLAVFLCVLLAVVRFIL